MVNLREIFGTLLGISLISNGLAEKLPPSILLQRPTMDFLVFTQETRGWFGLGFSGEIPKTVNPKKIFDSSCHPFSKKLVKILKEEFNFTNDDEILSNITMIDNIAWFCLPANENTVPEEYEEPNKWVRLDLL